MTLKISTPFELSEKERRYLYDEFDIEDRFDSKKKAFTTSDMVEKGEWERSEILEENEALWFFVFLSIGKIEAAGYLADCCNRNMGSIATGAMKYNLANFAFNLGAALGDEDCIEVLKKETTTSKIRENATKASVYVTDHANDFARFQNEGRQIYLKDVLGYAKAFNGLIKNLTGFSYLDNMPKSDFKSFLALTTFEVDNDVQLSGDVPMPDACCVMM